MNKGRLFEPIEIKKSTLSFNPHETRTPQVVGQVFKSSGVDYSQYHPNQSWSTFRKNWSLVDDEKDTETSTEFDTQTGLSGSRKDVYDAFVSFFGDLELKKIEEKGLNSIFVASLHALTESNRYVYVIVPYHNSAVGDVVKLSSVYWESFQTRTMRDRLDVLPQNYPSKTSYILQSPIVKTEDLSDGRTKYKVRRARLEVQMLKPPRTNQSYPDISKLDIALQTFNTVVYFV